MNPLDQLVGQVEALPPIPQPVDFEVVSAKPMRIAVTAPDGSHYVVVVALSVSDVRVSAEPLPNGQPKFDVDFNFAVSQRPA